MQPPAEDLDHLAQQPTKMGAVHLVAVNGAPLIASIRDMAPRARPFHAQRSSHPAHAATRGPLRQVGLPRKNGQ